MTSFFSTPNPDDAQYKSVLENEKIKRNEKRLKLFVAAVMVLIFTMMAIFHIVVVVAILL